MKILMGPVLSFKGYDKASNRWKLSALIVTDSDQPCPIFFTNAHAANAGQPETIWQNGKHFAHCLAFETPLSDSPATLTYSLEDGVYYDIHLPAKGDAPNMSYASCNGFSSQKVMKGVEVKNRMWQEMAKRHDNKPIHLMLLGGDQVYADSIWEVVPSIKEWNNKPNDAANKASFTKIMEKQVEAFYFNLYTERWAQPEVRAMMASIPSIAIWDDHDIFDGWGSYPPARQDCAVFQGIGAIATKAFGVFQQHIAPGGQKPDAYLAPDYGFSMGHVIGDTAILCLDMRSERSQRQVLSNDHWKQIYDWVSGLADIKHLFVMSSIPVVYPDFNVLESLLGVVPGQQELEDDLQDHWSSRSHKGERTRMVHRLFDFQKTGMRITILSGDVHVAALGILQNDRMEYDGKTRVINQLISSAIVHPAPSKMVLFALRHLLDNDKEIDPGIQSRMANLPGADVKFVGARNFLCLEPDDRNGQNRYWAHWIAEGQEEPFTKVIHPVPA
ncbi:alkaline phosphatase D family protein [Thalassospira sp. SM2505]|uniref:alkaline phosphatase D family protein n=1 Tax=Thalassospira sp. CH_XMU1448-2 TaxID=3107773 RepID=UPI0030087096